MLIVLGCVGTVCRVDKTSLERRDVRARLYVACRDSLASAGLAAGDAVDDACADGHDALIIQSC